MFTSLEAGDSSGSFSQVAAFMGPAADSHDDFPRLSIREENRKPSYLDKDVIQELVSPVCCDIMSCCDPLNYWYGNTEILETLASILSHQDLGSLCQVYHLHFFMQQIISFLRSRSV